MKIQDKAYHIKCFTCCACHQRLVPGDRFHFVNDRIFCESDFPLALRSAAPTTPTQQQPVCIQQLNDGNGNDDDDDNVNDDDDDDDGNDDNDK